MPNLTIIAGCNGAGKSTFGSSLIPNNIKSFDFDKLYLDYYQSLPDSEFRDLFAKNKTTELFENSIKNSLQKNLDFCYETNFDSLPIHWAQVFKDNGYSLNLIFFCIDNQEIARKRIEVRTEFKGHFIDNNTIDLKWKAGYKNMNSYYSFFDNVLIVDNSINQARYSNILQIKKGKIEVLANDLPEYFKRRFPSIYKQLKTVL